MCRALRVAMGRETLLLPVRSGARHEASNCSAGGGGPTGSTEAHGSTNPVPGNPGAAQLGRGSWATTSNLRVCWNIPQLPERINRFMMDVKKASSLLLLRARDKYFRCGGPCAQATTDSTRCVWVPSVTASDVTPPSQWFPIFFHVCPF